jgi:lipid-binding SYLF domain-containing protein
MTLANFSRIFLTAMIAAIVVQSPASAAKPEKIDRRVQTALTEFREDVKGAESVLARAKGVLIFPSITKGGFGFGGEYGEGALLIGGRTIAYYSTAAASVGFQIGLQSRRQMLVFYDDAVLARFRNSDNWEIGVDGSVTVVTLGAAGEIDTSSTNKPVVAFIFDSKGLMYNLSLEGSKITRIHKDKQVGS